MIREFSVWQARKCIKEYKKLNQAFSGMKTEAMYISDISNVVDDMLLRDTLDVLKGIPVEQLNANKAGYRVKVLKDYGLDTYGDLYGYSAKELMKLNGLGDSAYNIIRDVDCLAKEIKSRMRISLSVDHQDALSSSLVQSLFAYSRYKELKKLYLPLLNRLDVYQQRVIELKKDSGVFRWFFLSNEKKSQANRAYAMLSEGLRSSFFEECLNVFEKFKAIEDVSIGDGWEAFEKNPIDFINELEEVIPGIFSAEGTKYNLPEGFVEEIENEHIYTEGLLCTLRKYQEYGVKYILHQKRVLLGDEMGLGKTIQAIAVMVSLKNTGATHFMVVCPSSVLSNWCREIAKFSTLDVFRIHGNAKELAFTRWNEEGGVGVTTYETTDYVCDNVFSELSLLVVDEAHYIKNPTANRTKNTKKLCRCAQRLLFMTGTALENHIDEMISLLDILQPKIADIVGNYKAIANAPLFRQEIIPVYYRRKREDVLMELPELIEKEEWCILSKEEEVAYEEAILSHNYSLARRVSWNVDDTSVSSKAQRLAEIVARAGSENRKVIVFSFFIDTIEMIKKRFATQCIGPINGSVSSEKRLAMIDQFDQAKAGTILLSQIIAGGTGLNIQSGSVVVICEPQLKPSIENQAISRAYRMGQTRNVLVYRLLCEDTVDERIRELLKEKQMVFDAFADEADAYQMEIDAKTFGQIMEDEFRRVQERRVS